MSKKLSSIGLKRSYKPVNDVGNGERDPGRERILLECRRPATITDGVMKGAEMDIYDDSTVRVWTSQKQKANLIAKANGFKVRLLDGEAELYIPVSRADEFLHGLGAKVKKVMSPERIAKMALALANRTPEQKAAAMAGLAKARLARKTAKAVAA